MFASSPSRFPEFVADQVLTAQNLQDLFNYLDEQERLTRTNLIGIGIVCGLEVSVSNTSVTISQGVGVTSAGYLVAMPQRTYTHQQEFNAEKERLYDRFVDLGTKKQRFPIWELAVAGAPEAKTPLTDVFLKDKVALIFVELLETGNKNCDPDSCDDKGVTVTVTFRPLLVREEDAKSLIGKGDGRNGFRPRRSRCLNWPDLKIRRYNVPATTLPDSATILKNYLTLLDEAFIERLEKALSGVYSSLRLLVSGEFAQDPFGRLKDDFAFLYDGSLDIRQLIHIQYYYDFFSDLIQAYDELRTVCNRQLALCCPDEDLFPRHLLLGALFASKTVYRHAFIPSPAVAGAGDGADHLRFLFARLVRMVQTVQIPVLSESSRLKKIPIVITPSQLGDVPLSKKAIPYYYDVVDAPPLFEQWNAEKTEAGKADTNLSYHAGQYNSTDEWVKTPLRFDLEPYNFFRIEGHIGQNWQTAFREIYKQKQANRLPFDVVALNGDFRSLLLFIRQSLNNLAKVLAGQPERWRQILCYFADVEMQYDMQAAELRCTLGKVMRFLYDMQGIQANAANPPVSGLLRRFDPAYQTRDNSRGVDFDRWYPTVKDLPYISAASVLDNPEGLAANTGRNPLRLLMYYLEKIHEALPDGIVTLDIDTLTIRLKDAARMAEKLIQSIDSQNNENREQPETALILHLNAVVRVCKGSLLEELYRNFLFRFYLYMANQSFAMFSFLNGGIQHKAGVPVGGTFILVYHDALPQREPGDNIFRGQTFATAFRSEKEVVVTGTRRVSKDDDETDDLAEKVIRSKKDFAEFTAVKDTGVYWLTKLLAVRREEDELTDKELLELVEEIPDGVVIADFYLPYVCASECAPMSYIVLPDKDDEPAPVKPTISLQPTDFCQRDKEEYTPVVSPQGGESTGEGIIKKDDGTTVFIPATVDVGAVSHKKVTLTYTAGGQSATLEVTVFAMPDIGFTATPSTASPNTFSFEAFTNFGKGFIWDFGDGTTSTEKTVTHTYAASGAFTVTVTTQNGPCTARSKPQEVTVREQAVDKCVSLRIWFDAFNAFNTRPDRRLTAFKRAFAQYPEIAQAFGRFPDFIDKPQPDQLVGLAQVMPPALLQEWFKSLNVIIMENGDLRPYALELFRILMGVVVFYSCVPPEDIDRSQIQTLDLWAFITDALLPSWQNVAQRFSDVDKQLVRQLLADLQVENDRVRNGERDKRQYLRMLKRAIDALSGI